MSFLIDSNIFIYAADSSLPENSRALEVIRRVTAINPFTTKNLPF